MSGSITFGDLIGELDELKLVCLKCDRVADYSVRRLALQYGRKATIPDWIDLMTRDCPRKQPGNITDKCAASCPDLVRVVQQGPKGGDGNAA